MSSWLWAGFVSSVAALSLAIGGVAVKRRLRRLRDDHRLRPALWNRFYAVDWGDTATNNYGFAPADPADTAPDRFQRQLYREMLALLSRTNPRLPDGARLLEVSCGRGGGLDSFLAAAGPDRFRATGLDVAESAVRFCAERWADRKFVCGCAMALPFADSSFDVVLNVEASNDYPDRRRFFAEVHRVLRPGGIFLYADTEKAANQGRMARDLSDAGFAFDLADITGHVVEACRLDTPRRRAVIAARAPLPARLLLRRELANYAAVEGSAKFERFRTRERRYLMTAAVPA